MHIIERRKVLTGIGLTIGAAGMSSPAILGRAAAIARKGIDKGVYSSLWLVFAAIFLADRAGLWAKNGLEAEVKQVRAVLWPWLP